MDQGKLAQAEAFYRQALALEEKLVADFRTVPRYRMSLAMYHSNLGVLYARQRKLGEAEAARRRAVEVQEKLVADFPAVPQYRHGLALQLNNLGGDLLRQHQRQTETVIRQALAVEEKLVAEYPTVPKYRWMLGDIQSNLGTFFQEETKEPEKALRWFDKSIASNEEALRQGETLERINKALWRVYRHRDRCLVDLKRYSDALANLDKMIEVAPAMAAPEIRSHHAVTRAYAGQMAAAVKEAEELVSHTDDPVALYNAACVYALASVPSKTNPISSEQQARYGERAVALLRQSIARGFKRFQDMKKDDDLKALRQREDFKKLLSEMPK
jgi:tetratricopeptide (TPR) repeat protein